MATHDKHRAWLLWGLANLFFAFQFILRLSAGVLREDIIQKFGIDAASFGTLAGYYYLGYAGSQIPLGLMLDRFSFRLITSLSILSAAIGALTFTSDNWNMVLFGRFLIGVGSGVAFLAVTKVIKTYFEEKHQAMLIGLSFSFGLTGAVFGTTPMLIIFNHFGYDNTFNTLAIACIIISMLMLIFGKLSSTSSDDFSDDEAVKLESISSDTKYKKDNILLQILRLLFNPKLLTIAISGGLMVGSLEGFADVWALAYFEQVFDMSRIDSANIISFVYIGMCFGGPILALCARAIDSDRWVIFFTGTFTILVFLYLFYIPSISIMPACALMFFMGILCCYQVLVFSIVNNFVSTSNAGLAIAITQCVNMSFGHFFHQYIGNSIQTAWAGELIASGSPFYGREVFIISLAVIPVACFIGQIGFLIAGKRIKSVSAGEG